MEVNKGIIANFVNWLL